MGLTITPAHVPMNHEVIVAGIREAFESLDKATAERAISDAAIVIASRLSGLRLCGMTIAALMQEAFTPPMSVGEMFAIADRVARTQGGTYTASAPK